MQQEPWHPGKGTKTDHIIQLNYREVCTHASYKTSRTWEVINKACTLVSMSFAEKDEAQIP